MGDFLRVATIFCWAVGIFSEYVVQLWPKGKTLLNVIAVVAFVLALSGEYQTYREEQRAQQLLLAEIAEIGHPTTEWFQAIDGDSQNFTLKYNPIPKTLEVAINGLEEPNDVYSLQGRTVTVSTRMDHTDTVTIKYRHSQQ